MNTNDDNAKPTPMMSTPSIHLSATLLTFVAGDDASQAEHYVVPCGTTVLAERHFTHDPPLPEDLTNAIGDVIDHLDDAVRYLPLLAATPTVHLSGAPAWVLATVEHGGSLEPGKFVLSRDAAEEVFRTLATESVSDRARNPGLPAEHVSTIVAACCVVVAILRGLHLQEITVTCPGGEVST